ncbi:MAG: DUF2973 domain-containing protein [Cyanobacteria bacterium]|jgi:hypothetical protein|nr:DUF2973 domain-containing protein [Cyanobacteria bacterium GSL.Bin1]
MLHLLYIIAFTVIAFFAVSNLIRSLITLGTESQRTGNNWNSRRNRNTFNRNSYTSAQAPSHPELLDEQGKPVNEPLLVMRSVNVDDAREKLDALYNNSPGSNQEEDKD